MNKIIQVKSISEFHKMLGYAKPNHPLITFIDFSKVIEKAERREVLFSLDFYAIVYKRFESGTLRYGRGFYDFEEGALIFMAPGQVFSSSIDTKLLEGWALYFHRDLLHGTELGAKIHEYSFFGYEADEALHISDEEKALLQDHIKKLNREMADKIDSHTQTVLVNTIQLILSYCNRFYDRQFLTRKKTNSDLVQRFEILLNATVNSGSLSESRIPTVAFLASELSVSPTYLTDVLKRITGKSTQEHIHIQLVERAKNLLLSSTKSVSEISYELGFEYPSHFTKVFKDKTKLSPSQYRSLN
jgi:AraC-like DNA-binding protein